MTLETKEEAFEALEKARAEWLGLARSEAWKIACAKGHVTADDIHAACPIPKGVDGRVMGAVFITSDFEPRDFVLSRRKVCHKRPIRRFILRGAV